MFPARPKQLVKKARQLAHKQIHDLRRLGSPTAINPSYISWLKRQSMLATAVTLARTYSGKGAMWQNPYAKPRPRAAVKKASVWYTAYPMSMITEPGESMIASLGRQELWDAFEAIGIDGLHTGPMKAAGGLNKWDKTASIDGHFDRISNSIDTIFGTEAEFIAMTQTAARHKATIIDDIVPGHTGKGADFRLAEMAIGDYPGIYHMVEIERVDWDILPHVPRGKDSINLTAEVEKVLKQRGYIIGKLQRVIFYEPGVKETNWSVTRAVKGADGKVRRWVYLHYFWEGQPSINWLDPTFAGMRLVIGDALHSLGLLGTGGLRLDANGFLGVEVSDAGDLPAWSEGHPLSITANQIIASMVRKLGGFTFQEVNLSIDDIKKTAEMGADLSYDFVTRPAVQHALATGDAEFLRLMIDESQKLGVDPVSLVHALQNHDELTYELVHFWTIHSEEQYQFRGETMLGKEIREYIQKDLTDKLVSPADYNMTFTENGIACTTSSMIASILGFSDRKNLSDEMITQIQHVHLLLAKFNAWQPGVFALSGWDLVGALTLPRQQVNDLIGEGDTRWINRGAYDLIDANPDADESQTGMPKAESLYGSVSSQLNDPESFASKLSQILRLRKDLSLEISSQCRQPSVSETPVVAMVHRLTDDRLQMTILNFANKNIRTSVASSDFSSGIVLTDQFGQVIQVSEQGTVEVELTAYGGLCFVEDTFNRRTQI